MLVVDTSALIDFLQGRHTTAAQMLKAWELGGIPYTIPLICAQEVMQGARDLSEWKLLEKYIWSQELLTPLDPFKTHREAARIYFDLRRRGITVRSTIDCLVAQICIESKGQLLHRDDDYRRIAKVRELEFVIP